ncbi:MAG: hypothetical protein ISS15_19095 [Alphaproteobacteria bacterium]|nr:hypothetical protein [Alphaproteobacteria bacterium]MBL6940402.1 hypothetical protein [Alphaproteobacteria bacterium]MBL7099769.1 hypothetical protein [Alphaproteobacteria bacterium]
MNSPLPLASQPPLAANDPLAGIDESPAPHGQAGSGPRSWKRDLALVIGALDEAKPYGAVIDVETATIFVGYETPMPGNQPQLGRWRTWPHTLLASSALPPARFYHLPPNRVVELGTQVTI